MTIDHIAKLVGDLSDIQALPAYVQDAAGREKALERHTIDVVDQIASIHDWAFVLAVDDDTTDGSSEYTLEGANKDCREIINIRFGQTDFELLDKKSAVDMDEWLTGRNPSGTHWWFISGRGSGGFPKITLVDTPAADYTIRYRYRRKVKISDFPDELSELFVLKVAARLLPAYQELFLQELARVISRHEVGGGEDDPARKNYWIMLQNNRRAAKFGY